jgi:hypothetical protein
MAEITNKSTEEAGRQLEDALQPRLEWPAAVDERLVEAHERATAELRALEERDRYESSGVR